MANDTPKKPDKKAAPTGKAPDNKSVAVGGEAPAPKDQPDKVDKAPGKPGPEKTVPVERLEPFKGQPFKAASEKKPAAKTPGKADKPPEKSAGQKTPAPKNQPDKAPASEKPDLKNMIPFDKNKAAKKAPDVADDREEWEKPSAELDAAKKKPRTPRAPRRQANKGKAPASKTQPGKAKAPDGKAAPGKAKAPAAKAQADKAKTQQSAPPLENPFLKPSEKTGAKNKETIIEVDLAQLHPFHTFRKHPYKVKENAKMTELVESIKVNGVMQPGLARPEKDGNGFELIAGHRRRLASQLADAHKMPVIVREMTDLEAVRAMKDSNKQRDEDLPSERAALLDLELEALKHQGAQDVKNIPPEHVGKRSNEIVAETNGLTVKQVQRYIRLTKLTPELLDMVDDKKIGFTPAVEISYIQPKNQKYIAVAIEGQQSAPSLSQAQRMRELDQKNLLNPDVIDGILLEEKKEVEKVILSTQELGQYFGKEATPREMKDTILKLLDEYKDKQKDISPPEKKTEHEK